MDRKGINQHVMQVKSYKILDEYRSIFTHNPVVIEKIDHLGVLNNEIDALNDVQTEGTKGNTTQKSITKATLISSIIVVKSGLLALAASNKDPKIKETVDVSDTSLGRMRESDLKSFARVILALAKEHVEELQKWNIQQVKIDNLDSSITSFTEIIPSNQIAKGDITQNNILIKQKLKEAKDLLDDEIDLMVAPFGVDNPEFYARYLKAREIIEIAASHSTEEAPAADNKTQNN